MFLLGLEPCLWEGIQFTKLLLHKYKLPFIPIHHMEAHALMPRLFDPAMKFPFLTLLVSGGHCILALVEAENKFWRLGESIDISPGNFIDKVARKLGLFQINDGFTSGGALLEHFAKGGDPHRFEFIMKSVQEHCKRNKTCDFSFAGITLDFSLR
jgi:N6-L-threonylcarbamoyladenine synthase